MDAEIQVRESALRGGNLRYCGKSARYNPSQSERHARTSFSTRPSNCPSFRWNSTQVPNFRTAPSRTENLALGTVRLEREGDGSPFNHLGKQKPHDISRCRAD